MNQIIGFQVLVLRRAVPQIKRVLIGFAYVLLGLTLFLVGLEIALFPLGRVMASQLTAPDFLEIADAAKVLRQSNGTSFVLLRVDHSPPPKRKRNLQASEAKARFRSALLS